LRAAKTEPAAAAFFATEQGKVLKPRKRETPVGYLNRVFARQFPLKLGAGRPYPGGDLALFALFESQVITAWEDAPGRVVFSYKAGMEPGCSASFSMIDVKTQTPSLLLHQLSTQVRDLDAVWAQDTQAWAYLVPGAKEGRVFRAAPDYTITKADREMFAAATAKVLLDSKWRSGLPVRVSGA
jgi:hypothetical protein